MTMKKIFILFCALGLSACLGAGGEQTTLEYMPNMMDSPAVKAQEEPGRLPPEGTLPRDFQPYPFKYEEGEMAGLYLKNPLMSSLEVLKEGQEQYNTFCIVCHGPQGKGLGTVVPKFPMPPSLHSEKLRGWSDGRIFHVITKGQNLMSSYASQISVEERWAIVSYIRALQRSVNPTDADIEAYKKALKDKTYP